MGAKSTPQLAEAPGTERSPGPAAKGGLRGVSVDGDRKPMCDPQEVSTRIAPLLDRLREARNRPLFTLVAEQIDAEVWNQVYSWKHELRAAGKAGTVDVLIHSPGGVLTPCYMIARFLARCVDSWTALVPTLAASGATLVTLGSHEIIMSQGAQLGPLDPQVISKRPQKFFTTERQSPLEALELVTYVRELTFSSMDISMQELLSQGVAPQRALENSIEIATRVARPLLERIEPYDLAALRLDSRLALLYCERVARPTDSSKKTQREANYRDLVEYFPAHEFAIDIAEAGDGLKFNVSEPEGEIEGIFDALRPELERSRAYIGLVPSNPAHRS